MNLTIGNILEKFPFLKISNSYVNWKKRQKNCKVFYRILIIIILVLFLILPLIVIIETFKSYYTVMIDLKEIYGNAVKEYINKQAAIYGNMPKTKKKGSYPEPFPYK